MSINYLQTSEFNGIKLFLFDLYSIASNPNVVEWCTPGHSGGKSIGEIKKENKNEK